MFFSLFVVSVLCWWQLEVCKYFSHTALYSFDSNMNCLIHVYILILTLQSYSLITTLLECELHIIASFIGVNSHFGY